MEKVAELLKALMIEATFDCTAVGIIDFKAKKFETIVATKEGPEIRVAKNSPLYFDLASITKVLTNSLSYFLRPEVFDEKTLLCLNHRAGIPAWAILSQDNWKEFILSYPIKESPTLYSDLGALRLMLELEKKKVDMKSLCKSVWDKEMIYWLDLDPAFPTLQYGFKNGVANFGAVHDPNAYNLHTFCSHAGLFSTLDGLCQTLLNYEQKTSFVEKVNKDSDKHKHRFAFGWDRVEDPNNTSAGLGCGPRTFGHLGFTGTSVWIDPDRQRGHVILTNATKNHWFDKTQLNVIRQEIGKLVWKM